ncbi:hypothetical protein AJ79_04240 [Helicocarpus griseus UAMH5409]|uniref:Uncharacterized protein n=1 Tax=Helicocarpus griseus UAMH5409 TaxID=1447875 RepID=A0A2B7XTH2_9EURO|nr:hypothetical protein AJ79_04240 [Helicocarpus griseus UAMH5409]
MPPPKRKSATGVTDNGVKKPRLSAGNPPHETAASTRPKRATRASHVGGESVMLELAKSTRGRAVNTNKSEDVNGEEG